MKEPYYLYTIDLIACFLSAIGSAIMTYFCLRIPTEIRTSSIKYLAAVAISDFFYSIGNLMSAFNQPNDTYCEIEGFFRHSSLVFSSLFAACIAVVSYGTSLSPKMHKIKTTLLSCITVSFCFLGALCLFG